MDMTAKLKPFFLMLSLLFVLFLFACSQEKKTGVSPTTAGPEATVVAKRPVTKASGAPAAEPPYLRTVLPQNAGFYLRHPNFWGMIGQPKDNIFSTAIDSAPYAKMIQTIREGLNDSIRQEYPQEINPIVRLLLVHSRSPVEAVVLKPDEDQASPLPELLVFVAVDFDSHKGLNGFFQDCASVYPEIRVEEPLDEAGAGRLVINGIPVQVVFRADSRRLFFLASLNAQPGTLRTMVNNLQPVADHVMHKLEKEIDSSGQGLFAWLDTQALFSQLSKMGQGPQVAMLSIFGIHKVQAIGLGAGVSNGKQRLKLVVDMPHVGIRTLLPKAKNDVALNAAGDPRYVVMLGLPAREDLKAMETTFGTIMAPQERENYQQAKKRFHEAVGIGVEEMFDVIGPEFLVLRDEAGQYCALHIRDKEGYEKLLGQLTAKFELNYKTRTISGRKYHQLAIPSLFSMIEDGEADADKMHPLFLRFLQIPTHLYWVEEDDYLVLASVPQVLMDRGYLAHKVSIRDWLLEEQKIAFNDALLLAGVRSPDLPKLIYNFNLKMLIGLGDLVDRPVDIFALPSALEAELPSHGTFSAVLRSSDSSLSLEMNFESNPFEVLLTGSGMQTAAVAGIVAAMAIPQFQAYRERAKEIQKRQH